MKSDESQSTPPYQIDRTLVLDKEGKRVLVSIHGGYTPGTVVWYVTYGIDSRYCTVPRFPGSQFFLFRHFQLLVLRRLGMELGNWVSLPSGFRSILLLLLCPLIFPRPRFSSFPLFFLTQTAGIRPRYP